MRGLPDGDLGGLYGRFIRGEEPGGLLTPVEANVERYQSGGDESRDREGLGLPLVTTEKTKKSKKRKYMEVVAHDLEVRIMEAPAKVRQKRLSYSDQGEQTMNTHPQIRDFTAVNHNQDMLCVKVWRGVEEERKEEHCKKQKELVTWQLPSINTIQQRSQWVAALEVQQRRTRQIEKQRKRKATEAKKGALRIPKKPLTLEEKRERNRLKNDRHRALRTPQMIADDKERNRKLYNWELAKLPHSRGVHFRAQSGPVV